MTPEEGSEQDTETPEESDAETDGDVVEETDIAKETDTAEENSVADDAGTRDEETEMEQTDVDPSSISKIETISIDPDAVVRAIAYNGQEDIGRKGKAVFSLTPPFDETVEPTIRHLVDDSTESKSDGEIHLRPFRFVAEGRRVVDQRPTRHLAIEELDADDPDTGTVEAWIDEAMETWKAHVRENLIGSVDIFSPHGMAIVRVEYTESEDDS